MARAAGYLSSVQALPTRLHVLALDTTGKLPPGLDDDRSAVAGIELATGYTKLDFVRRKRHTASVVQRVVQRPSVSTAPMACWWR